MVRFLKTFVIWVVFKKNRWFWKKNLNVVEILKAGKFAVECVSNGIMSYHRPNQYHFRPNQEVFLAKNQKTLNVGKIRKHDEVFFRKENFFIFLKGFFTKMGDAKFPIGSRPSCWIVRFI